ncbi:MAG: hypothetical protein JWN48_2704, partial [Myxococcaceae bacterium]|nr:hypothetical protein [Myxococcaceae bacterium]
MYPLPKGLQVGNDRRMRIGPAACCILSLIFGACEDDETSATDAGRVCSDARCPEGGTGDDASAPAHPNLDAAAPVMDGSSAPAADAGLASDGAAAATDASGATRPDGAVGSYLCGAGPSAGVLLNLGHAYAPSAVMRAGNRVVSSSPGWVLWDLDTQSQLASGGADHRLFDLQDDEFVVGGRAGVELRSLSDGHLIAEMPGVASATFSSDGTFLWGTSADGAWMAWSLTGQLLYSGVANAARQDSVSARENQIRFVSNGATTAVSVLSITDKKTTLTPNFEGEFRTWFSDGSHFITQSTDVMRVYSKDAELQILVSLPQAQKYGGFGQYYWRVVDQVLNVYAIGNDTSLLTVSVAGSPGPRELGTGQVAFPIGSNITIVDLTSHPPSVRVQSTSADTTSAELSMGRDGMVDLVYRTFPITASAPASPSDRVMLGCGTLSAAGASPTGRVALGTTDGIVRVFDLQSAVSQPILGIAVQADKLQLTPDGATALILSQGTLSSYSLTTGQVQKSWTHDATSKVYDFEISADGKRLGQVICSYSVGQVSDRTCRRTVTDLDGPSTYFDASVTDSPDTSAPGAIALSPTGTRVAFARDAVVEFGGSPLPYKGRTLVYQGDGLIGANDGSVFPGGWVDEGHLLIDRFRVASGT